jgi:peptidoglycan/LPS O-acetylase OafA/YrhL
MQKTYVGGIQALRLLACLFVVFQHVVFFTCYFKGLDYRPYLMINFGRLGVSLFFVISGYVMGLCLDQGRQFLWKRVSRVYPPYWLAIGLSWLLLVPLGIDWTFDFWSALLLPTYQGNNSYRIPYWTLCYEMAFYGLLYVLILLKISRRGILVFCAGWLLAIVAVDAYKVRGNIDAPEVFALIAQPGWYILLSPYCIFFVAGLFVSIMNVKISSSIPSVYLGVAAICIWGVSNSIAFPSPAPLFILQSISFIFLIEVSKKIDFPNAIVRLGDYSYGIYLAHMIIIVAVLAILKANGVQMRFAAIFSILLLCALVGGCVFGWLEYKLHNQFVRQLFKVDVKRV